MSESLSVRTSDWKETIVPPLFIAAENGHIKIVRMLVEQGMDVNVVRDDGCTPLYVAACTGHADVLKVLLTSGA